ncbi:MAG TPA: hypothetical protein VJX67_04280 [Blastocatellia bacterium]|nr:hypothetical protein [Blastocatellia bacterium]
MSILPTLSPLGFTTTRGRSRVPGIKLHDTRVIRLMEVLLHCGTKITGRRAADIREAILATFGLQAKDYTLTHLRYDLRKMNAHGLIERDGKRYAYRLTPKGSKVALISVLFHKRVCGPLANSLFSSPSGAQLNSLTKIEKAYQGADRSFGGFSTFSPHDKCERAVLKP